LAAVISPTVDMFTMVGLMVPLYLLYELGIILLVVAPTQAVAEGGIMRNALGTMIGRPKYKAKKTDGDEGDEEGG
jgi:Sec-independent protein secretion pathway component TatC